MLANASDKIELGSAEKVFPGGRSQESVASRFRLCCPCFLYQAMYYKKDNARFLKVPILFSQHEHRTLTGQKLYFKRVLPLFSKPELGLLPFLPAFGIVVIDPDEPYGRIIVEMYPHHSDSFAPTFELRPDRDPHWYKH
jgi:hypothetical protein